MGNRKLYRLVTSFIIAGIVALSVAATTSLADAQDSSLAAPLTPDKLWVQVQSCIEYALTNGKLNLILPYSVPAQVCVWIDAPMTMNRYIGAGYTVLKDIDATNKPAAFLTLPSKVVTGIEDPQVTFFAKNQSGLSSSDSYFADAWGEFLQTVDALYFKQHSKHLKLTQEGMAVNSIASRGLNQLHIHMACVLSAVQTALANAKITSQWSSKPITLPPSSHSYYAINVSSLVTSNPFLEMQSEPHFKSAAPGNETLVVTGAPNGYYILLDYVNGADKAFGEELLDQKCNQ
jgi:CDP-diacylglycerol pyrophosphatase